MVTQRSYERSETQRNWKLFEPSLTYTYLSCNKLRKGLRRLEQKSLEIKSAKYLANLQLAKTLRLRSWTYFRAIRGLIFIAMF